jgi:hypothetical protein
MQKKYFFPILFLSGLIMIPYPAYAAPTASAHKSVNSRAAERINFMRETGYPDGRPGYVVDYIVSPECGGSTDTSNMQWLTEEEANKKAQEKKDCPDKNPDKNK